MNLRSSSEDILKHPYSNKRHSNFIDKDTVWTIGTTGGAAFDSISSAFNYIKLNNVIVTPGKTLTLRINTGYIAKEQVLIENMNLNGVVLQSDSLISVDLRGLTLNTLDTYKYFICVNKSTALTIKAKFDFTISKATVTDVCGVLISTSTAIRVDGSTFSNFSRVGIYARLNTTLELSACTLTQNATHGIYVTNGASANINNCTTNSNALSGIVVYQAASANIYNCTANSNTSSGINVGAGASVNINSCTANLNAQNGIYVTNGASANINNCTTNSNTVNGIYVAYGASANLYNCTANSNTANGIYVARGASANVRTTNGQKTIGTNSSTDFVCTDAALLTLSGCTGGQNLTPGTATAAGLILRVD